MRYMFERYLELGSVNKLYHELADKGLRSKHWVTSKGRSMGNKPFSRGSLFHLLRRRVYLGQIVHKDKVYEGEHAAIIETELFERVQAKLDSQARRHKAKRKMRLVAAPLMGKLFDAHGEAMSPSTSRGQSGRAYRYYVSASLQQGLKPACEDIVQRLAAPDIERAVGEATRRWLPDCSDALASVRSVHIVTAGLQVAVPAAPAKHIVSRLLEGEEIIDRTDDSITILLPVTLPLRGGRRLVIPSNQQKPQPDATLIAALRKAHSMLDRHRGLPSMEAAPVSPYDRVILRLALLAPDIQQAILAGRQPPEFNLERFKKITVPLAWSKQRKLLGFSESPVS